MQAETTRNKIAESDGIHAAEGVVLQAGEVLPGICQVRIIWEIRTFSNVNDLKDVLPIRLAIWITAQAERRQLPGGRESYRPQPTRRRGASFVVPRQVLSEKDRYLFLYPFLVFPFHDHPEVVLKSGEGGTCPPINHSH